MKWRLKTRLHLLKRQLKRVLSRKISNRLMLTYIALGVLPLVIVSAFLISLTQETVQSYILKINQETAHRASNEIYLFLQDPLTILRTTAVTRDIYDMDAFIQSSLINRIKEKNPIFNKIFVLNDSGHVTVTTQFGEEDHNFSAQPYFQDKVEYFSEVYFSPSRFPLLTIAEPIMRFNQQVGMLVAEIDLKNIWTLVDSVTIGKTGFAFLLSADGQVIAHRDKDKVFNREDYSRYPFYQRLKSGETDWIKHDIGSSSQILVYVPVPRLGWSVIVEQAQEEAFQLAHQMQRNVFFFTALTVGIAIILGILGVRRFTRPLLELVRGAREYERGNLSHEIHLPAGDELAALAEEFNTMAKSLQDNQRKLQRMERLAALSRFAAMVSHEVRNPLNSMNINMQILKRAILKPDIPAERKIKYLDVLSSEINRINDLVTNFLTIARPPELNPVRTDLHAVLEEIVLLQKGRALAEGIKLTTHFSSEPLVGLFDDSQLKQVFLNILINAFEAIHDEGELQIKTRVITAQLPDETKTYALIEFKDDGEGIPEEAIREVFEFYHTSKRTGSGLGLAIAKQIIEGHHGKIRIRSKAGAGTAVLVELPIEAPKEH